MGYFDALTSSSFKTASDGTRLFFPWGTLGSGYSIASEQDYLRLRRQIKIYLTVSLVLIVVCNPFLGYLITFAIVALLIGFYLVWMRYTLRELKKSSERLSLQESMTSQALAHNLTTLWLLQVAAVAFVVIGVVMLFASPGSRLIGLLSVLFFGVCGIFNARMIAMRRRETIIGP
jgi:hypothetical protein